MGKKNDDVDVDVAQRESSSIKCYDSAFSNILIIEISLLTPGNIEWK